MTDIEKLIKLLEHAESFSLQAYGKSPNLSECSLNIQYLRACILQAIDNAKALRERLAPEQRPLINPPACTWTHDDDEGSWDAECGERWVITNGTPEENNFRFCPGCGRTVKTIFVTPRK